MSQVSNGSSRQKPPRRTRLKILFALVLAAVLVAVWLWPRQRSETAGRGRERGGAATADPDDGPGLLDFLFGASSEDEPGEGAEFKERPSGSREAPDEGAVVSGRVLRAEDGLPVMGARVMGRTNRSPRDWTPFDDDKAEYRAETDDDGRYRIQGIDEGELFLRVRAPDLAAADQTVELDAFEIRRGVDFLMVESGAVAGRIAVRETGAPVKGFLVLGVSPQDKGGITATSDAEGQYRIDGLVPGRNVVIPRPGSSDYRVTGGFRRMFREVEIEPGQVVRGIDFAVCRGAAVAGRVTEKGEEPVRGATLFVRPASGGGDFFGMAETDTQGRYRVGGLPAGAPAVVRVKLTGFRPDEKEITLPGDVAAAEQADFVLERACTASGRVLGISREPLAGAEVRAEVQRDPAEVHKLDHRSVRFHADASTTSGDDGRFELEALYAERYRLLGRMGGWAGTVEGPEFGCEAGQRVTGLELVLEPPEGGTISGQVVDGKGNPVQDASVSSSSKYGSPMWELMKQVSGQLAARTGPDGRFRLVGLRGDALDLFASHPFYAEAKAEQVAVGTQDLLLTLKSLGIIRGRVRVEGDPEALPPHFRVGTCKADTADAEARCLERRGVLIFGERKSKLFGAGDEGRFELRDIEPGPAVVVVHADGYRPGAARVEVPEGGAVEDVEIALGPGAAISGVVIDASGRGVGGALVRAVIATDDNRERLSRGMAGTFHEGEVAHSASGGGFRIAGLREGDYLVAAQHASYASAPTVRVELSGDGEVSGLRLELSEGGRVEGRLSEGGRPQSGRSVMLMGRRTVDSAATDPDGRFVLEQVPGGRYSLMVPREDEPFLKLPLVVRKGEVTRLDIDLGALGTVSGRLAGHEPGQALALFLRPPGVPGIGEGEALAPAERARRDHELSVGFTMVQPDGSFRFDPVVAGQYVLEVVARTIPGEEQRAGSLARDERSVIWREIEVPPGGEVRLELTIEADGAEESP